MCAARTALPNPQAAFGDRGEQRRMLELTDATAVIPFEDDKETKNPAFEIHATHERPKFDIMCARF